MTPDLRFPLGPLDQLPAAERVPATLERFAARMEEAVGEWHSLASGLNADALARPYREGGWTVHQLVHHVADAHLHGLIRLRGGLTQDEYPIQVFDQEASLTLPDSELPIAVPLALLEVINRRWVTLLRSVEPEQFARYVVHPQEGRHDLWQLAHKHD
jgi:Mycothiol maleylpyruvate isomerase N-terminal domain